jgi:RNA polymerase sigma-70 factor (ECF subfamily)
MSSRWLQNIFYQYAGTVYRTAKSIIKDEQISEDITQESFVELHIMGKNRFSHNDKVRAWLLKTATNKALNYIKKKNPVYVSTDFFDNIKTDFKTNPETELTKKELIQEIKNAVQVLPDDYRAVILLYYYADLSYMEISSLLSIPMGTVKSRLSRGRLLIRKNLIGSEEKLEEGAYQHE